jgi:hypothetical protein
MNMHILTSLKYKDLFFSDFYAAKKDSSFCRCKGSSMRMRRSLAVFSRATRTPWYLSVYNIDR